MISFTTIGRSNFEHSKKFFDGQAASESNGAMVGLIAQTREQVDAFHAAALVHGGSCEGKRGLRKAYGPNMYLAYVRDPMGNQFAAPCTAEAV
jgi:predicted lactoylglutathione lyase